MAGERVVTLTCFGRVKSSVIQLWETSSGKVHRILEDSNPHELLSARLGDKGRLLYQPILERWTVVDVHNPNERSKGRRRVSVNVMLGEDLAKRISDAAKKGGIQKGVLIEAVLTERFPLKRKSKKAKKRS